MDGCRHGITSVRVITPVLPPEPPVGAGWFTEDGVLWQRSTLDPADVGSDIPGPWHAVIDGAWALRAWSDIQPGRPAVPAGGDE
jgi:hypothetical protein